MARLPACCFSNCAATASASKAKEIMTRDLTQAEQSKIDAGILPVLRSTPDCVNDELDLCIGWASDAAEALAILRSHVDVELTVDIPGLPLALLCSAIRTPLMVGDKNGRCFPFVRPSQPGTYYVIEAFVPAYDPFSQ